MPFMPNEDKSKKRGRFVPNKTKESFAIPNPMEVIADGAPSNLGKLFGVGTANAPGAASLGLSAMPGNARDIMPAIQNLMKNPGQVSQALSRVVQVQAGSPLQQQEKLPARAGQIAGMGVEMMAPGESSAALQGASRNLAQRALGFSKRFLNSPQSRRKAVLAAETALENDVIPLSGNPVTMMQRARSLSGQVGGELGSMRSEAGEQSIKPIINSLETLKSKLVIGSGGEWSSILGRINHAINTVKGLVKKGTIEAAPEMQQTTGILGPTGKEITKTIPAVKEYIPPTTINKMEEAKKVLADTVNWLTDTPGRAKQMKSIIRSIEGGVEDILRNTGTDMLQYQKLKKIYGAAESMKMALNNELSSTGGNQLLSMKPAIVATGELASGNPIKAAMTGIGSQLVKNRGAGTSAVLLRNLNKAKPVRYGVASLLNQMRKKKNEDSNP